MKLMITRGENYPYDPFGMDDHYFLVHDFEVDKYQQLLWDYIEDLPDCPQCDTTARAHIGVYVKDFSDIREFLLLPKRAYPTPEERSMMITIGSMQEKLDLIMAVRYQRKVLKAALHLIKEANELIPDSIPFDSKPVIEEIDNILFLSGEQDETTY